MKYTIGEFSKLTGLGIHTLRYYEKEGLIMPTRDQNNLRYYSELEFNRITFIKRLKAMGTPIKQIKQYTLWRDQGDSTLEDRRSLLMDIKQSVLKEIDELQEHLSAIEDKIHYYDQEIKKVTPQ